LGGAWGWLKSRIAGGTGEREEEEYEEEYEEEWDEEDDLSLAQTQGNVLIAETQGNILVAQTQGNLRVGGGNPQTIRHALPQVQCTHCALTTPHYTLTKHSLHLTIHSRYTDMPCRRRRSCR
jgi:hypothetical protein